MDLQLQNQVVLVTGSGQGIGREIARAFAAEGARVAVHYLSSAAGAEETVATIRRQGGQAKAFQADVTDPGAVQALVAAVTSELGPVDVLVNNAAYIIKGRFQDSNPADWAPVFGVTLTGAMLCSQAVLPGMIERKAGKIITLTGDSGRVGESNLVVTSAARAGAIGFTKALAKEVGRFNINVNCISLGIVKTPSIANHLGGDFEAKLERILPMYPLRRVGEMGDVPPMALFLASPLSSWVTGQTISLNGGYSMV